MSLLLSCQGVICFFWRSKVVKWRWSQASTQHANCSKQFNIGDLPQSHFGFIFGLLHCSKTHSALSSTLSLMLIASDIVVTNSYAVSTFTIWTFFFIPVNLICDLAKSSSTCVFVFCCLRQIQSDYLVFNAIALATVFNFPLSCLSG